MRAKVLAATVASLTIHSSVVFADQVLRRYSVLREEQRYDLTVSEKSTEAPTYKTISVAVQAKRLEADIISSKKIEMEREAVAVLAKFVLEKKTKGVPVEVLSFFRPRVFWIVDSHSLIERKSPNNNRYDLSSAGVLRGRALAKSSIEQEFLFSIGGVDCDGVGANELVSNENGFVVKQFSYTLTCYADLLAEAEVEFVPSRSFKF